MAYQQTITINNFADWLNAGNITIPPTIPITDYTDSPYKTPAQWGVLPNLHITRIETEWIGTANFTDPLNSPGTWIYYNIPGNGNVNLATGEITPNFDITGVSWDVQGTVGGHGMDTNGSDTISLLFNNRVPSNGQVIQLTTVKLTITFYESGPPPPPTTGETGSTPQDGLGFAVSAFGRRIREMLDAYCEVVGPSLYVKLGPGNTLPLGYQFYRDYSADFLYFQPGLNKTAATSGSALNSVTGIRVIPGQHGNVGAVGVREGLITYPSPYVEQNPAAVDFTSVMTVPGVIPWGGKRCILVVEIHGCDLTQAGGTDTIEFSLIPYARKG